MDILIKSFNRAYFLDRCLHSIYKNVKHFNGKIYVLDDGTPLVYLNKIKEKYPEITILKSASYLEKSTLLSTENYNLPNRIPSKLWHESALNTSDYILILEDDMWLNSTLDVNLTENFLTKHNIGLLKLLWLQNPKLIGNTILKEEDFVIYQPYLKIKNPLLFRFIYQKNHPFWKKIVTQLGWYSQTYHLNYYAIYAVAGAIYKRDYYLHIWKNATQNIDENLQLQNALHYSNSNAIAFAKTNEERVKTSFISSAFTKKEYTHFSVHDFNKVLNQYWLQNPNPFLKSLENDIDNSIISSILEAAGKEELYIKQWNDWMLQFKTSFIKIGCDI